ncbi:hypothetical protein HPB47_015840 [Ixodes persulcatus]|uniref:Uncharacterized protein n=1 Tax=Ixodes persulcatus TaxID=34615 RepID=A0AC60QW18_IXOPE|nr:hypothetical protein HPB47_015840 [Ixodes persulcatus]
MKKSPEYPFKGQTSQPADCEGVFEGIPSKVLNPDFKKLSHEDQKRTVQGFARAAMQSSYCSEEQRVRQMLKHDVAIVTSQPVVNGRPAGNIFLTSHLVFSGVKIAPTLRMLRHMNVQVISGSSFYKHRKAFTLPAVHKVWLQEQQELLNELENKEVGVSADGRFDFPGFCAKYLTYTVHVEQINKILHSVQVQLKEASSRI